jgi:tetratricopeptide (TPR) repeat protein
MPRAPVVDVDHAVYTDHSIPRRPPEAGPRLRPAATALVPFWGGTPEQRELALAYAEAAAVEQNARLATRAFTLLDRLAPGLPGDAPALEQLGYLYDRRGDARSAAAWYARALAADPSRVVARVNLGGLFARAGQLEAAAERWVDVLSRNPGLELPRVYLVQAYRRLGLTEQAREAARMGLQFYPDNPVLLEAAK